MKRSLILILSAAILIAMTACSPGTSSVVTTASQTVTSIATSASSATTTAATTAITTASMVPTTTQPTTTQPTTAQPTTTTTTRIPASGTYGVKAAYTNLTFEQPLYFAVARDGTRNAYVVERTGRIRIFEDRADVASSSIFLDLRSRIDASGQEKGLLGLAFHPEFEKNGYFYVNYTNRDSTIISRFTRRADNAVLADPASELVLLTFAQPFANHNGGHLEFGPDNLLYIATGDGGSGGDPQNNAQNRANLLGKILRIDVDHPSGGRPYGIPSDNPFAGNGQGFREEIYAYGLRNPWRFSFDASGTLWAADVGQSKREEIDLIEKGRNYGWSVMEGTLDYKTIAGVNKAELVGPIFEYDRAQGQSITGGYVYAGNQIPDLKGTYVYGDFGSGRIWALWFNSARLVQNKLLIDTSLGIASFGVDAEGELRIVDLAGKLYRLVPGG